MKKFLTDPKQQSAKFLLDWLYSDEEAILIQFRDKSCTCIFTRLPLDSQIDLVLYNNVTPFMRGKKRSEQELFGYWLKDKKICIVGYVKKYTDFLIEILSNDLWNLYIGYKCKEFVYAIDIIEDMNKLATNRLCHMYIKKHPVLDCAIDEKLQNAIQKTLDCYWLHNNIPKDIYDYVKNFGKAKKLTFEINDRLLLRYANGDESALSELLTPYLEEEKSLCSSTIEENIQTIKKDFEFGYALFKVLSTFTPSRRAIYTKKIVDAVQAFAKSHNVRNCEVKFSQYGCVYTQSFPYSYFSDYDYLYYYVDPENILSIMHGRTKIYVK